MSFQRSATELPLQIEPSGWHQVMSLMRESNLSSILIRIILRAEVEPVTRLELVTRNLQNCRSAN